MSKTFSSFPPPGALSFFFELKRARDHSVDAIKTGETAKPGVPDDAAPKRRARMPVGSKYSNSRRVSSLHLSRIDYIENREAA